MTTESLSNTLLPGEALEPTGLWRHLSAFSQAFRMATELSAMLQVLPPEKQADFARRYFQERS